MGKIRTVACQAPLSMGILLIEYWSELPCPPPGDLPNPKIEPRSLAFQVDYLPSEPPGKPKTTGVGSLSLLQRIFPTQESNRALLYCRQVLYQLSYQGSPLAWSIMYHLERQCGIWRPTLEVKAFLPPPQDDLLLFILLYPVPLIKPEEHIFSIVFLCSWHILNLEEPGGLQSMGSLRVGHDWATSLSLFTFMHWRRKWQLAPVFLPGESQGRRSLVGCSPWGR